MTPWRSSDVFEGSLAGHSGALHTGVRVSVAKSFAVGTVAAPPSGIASTSCAEGVSPASPSVDCEVEGETADGCPLHPERPPASARPTAPAPAKGSHFIPTGRKPSGQLAQHFCKPTVIGSRPMVFGWMRRFTPLALLLVVHAVVLGTAMPAFAQKAAQQQDLVARGRALFDDQQYEESVQTLSAALLRPEQHEGAEGRDLPAPRAQLHHAEPQGRGRERRARPPRPAARLRATCQRVAAVPRLLRRREEALGGRRAPGLVKESAPAAPS
jgi:hypothetical protein